MYGNLKVPQSYESFSCLLLLYRESGVKCLASSKRALSPGLRSSPRNNRACSRPCEVLRVDFGLMFRGVAIGRPSFCRAHKCAARRCIGVGTSLTFKLPVSAASVRLLLDPHIWVVILAIQVIGVRHLAPAFWQRCALLLRAHAYPAERLMVQDVAHRKIQCKLLGPISLIDRTLVNSRSPHPACD